MWDHSPLYLQVTMDGIHFLPSKENHMATVNVQVDFVSFNDSQGWCFHLALLRLLIYFC